MKERSTRCPPKLRILSALLAFAMLLTLLPVTAFAADQYRTIDDVQYVKMDGAIIWRVKSYSGSKSDLTLETSLDKGTQRKTTENELPSLTQCTA